MKWTRVRGEDGRWEYVSGEYRIAKSMEPWRPRLWNLFVGGKRYPSGRETFHEYSDAKVVAELHAEDRTEKP